MGGGKTNACRPIFSRLSQGCLLDRKMLSQTKARRFTKRGFRTRQKIKYGRKEKHMPEMLCVSERDVIASISGQAYAQAPNRLPRKIETVMAKVVEKFRANSCKSDDFYFYELEPDKVHDFFKNLLWDIPEFQEWNLSQVEYEKGITVDDESRGKFAFVDRYHSIPWMHDFIDLDAYVGNAVRRFWNQYDAELDCFTCIHKKSNAEQCTNCIRNCERTDNFEANKPLEEAMVKEYNDDLAALNRQQ
jgi:hypothetical protein